ncbi:hypothetical protein KBC79_00830 [Candidatus Woesebacteria bacterium]|nr:hypothetical protein [Candidatus Woesebacteria bacterium]
MDTTIAQPPQYQSDQPVQDSYADAYVPPTSNQPNTQQQLPSDDQQNQQPMDVRQDDAPVQDEQVRQSVPPSDQPAPSSSSDPVSAVQPPTPSEELADQNIFEMLGVTTGTTEQREQFLDELQQVIWDDFIEHDTSLLLTDDEQVELKKIIDSSPEKNLEQQEQVVVFLEKLVPDLEEIMLEKALQLKEEMARERLKALRELNRNDAEKLASIDRAEQLMSEQQWRAATELLNTLS